MCKGEIYAPFAPRNNNGFLDKLGSVADHARGGTKEAICEIGLSQNSHAHADFHLRLGEFLKETNIFLSIFLFCPSEGINCEGRGKTASQLYILEKNLNRSLYTH